MKARIIDRPYAARPSVYVLDQPITIFGSVADCVYVTPEGDFYGMLTPDGHVPFDPPVKCEDSGWFFEAKPLGNEPLPLVNPLVNERARWRRTLQQLIDNGDSLSETGDDYGND